MGNNTLSLLAGTETWTETLAKEFIKLGHKVTLYSPSLGYIATKLEGVGAHCINSLQTEDGLKRFDFVMQEGNGKFDIIICNHNQITKDLHAAYPDIPIIATIHGIIHKDANTGQIWPEHPVTEFKIDQFVSVSEEVQQMLKKQYGLESVIIRNFVDTKRFEKKKKMNKHPKTFLINSNYWGTDSPINAAIKEVANHFEAKVMAIGTNFVPTYEVEMVLEDCDIVFGMGRGLIEGMSAGCLAVCMGRWGTEGPITTKNYESIRSSNFSGRSADGKLLTPQDLVAYIKDAYTKKNIDEMHNLVLENHNVKKSAKEYIKIAEKLIK